MEVSVVMRMARESLKGRWGIAVGTFFIYSLIIGALGSTGFLSAVNLIIAGPFAIGLAIFSLAISREQEAKIEMIFDGFKDFVRGLVAYLWILVLVLLYLLLLIIPGIIKAFAVSMTYFIMVDDPSIGPREAVAKSEEMMYGYKGKLFEMYIYFFLLSLLCLLTLGIGFLFLFPYAYICMAKFYGEIKDSPIARE